MATDDSRRRESLAGRVVPGETLFKAGARLQLPEPYDLATLKKDLGKIAAHLLVDVSFVEVSEK